MIKNLKSVGKRASKASPHKSPCSKVNLAPITTSTVSHDGVSIVDFNKFSKTHDNQRNTSERWPVAKYNKLDKPIDGLVIVDPFHAGEELVNTALKYNYFVLIVFTLDQSICMEENRSLHLLRNHGRVQILFTSDTDEIMDCINQCPNLVIRGILPGSEPGVILATKLAASLELPSNDVSLIAAARNKYVMRRVVAEAGLTSPKFQLCTEEFDVELFCQNVTFPVILKTPQGAGTNLVRKCRSLLEAKRAFHEICMEQDLFGQRAQSVVIEEFIDGDEFAINLFHNGDRIYIVDTWKYEKVCNHLADHLYRNIILFNEQTDEITAMHDYAIKVAQAVGLRVGYAHCEIKFCPVRNEPVLIEIGLRQPGAGLTEHGLANTGFDPYQSTIQVFRYGSVPIEPEKFKYQKNCAVLFGTVETKGSITQISGQEQIMALPSYRSHTVSVHNGQFVKPTLDMTGVPWCVHVAHESREQLLADIETIHQTLKLNIQQY